MSWFFCFGIVSFFCSQQEMRKERKKNIPEEEEVARDSLGTIMSGVKCLRRLPDRWDD